MTICCMFLATGIKSGTETIPGTEGSWMGEVSFGPLGAAHNHHLQVSHQGSFEHQEWQETVGTKDTGAWETPSCRVGGSELFSGGYSD